MSSTAEKRQTTVSHRPLHARHPLPWLIFTLIVALLIYGWRLRDQNVYSPKDGAGFYLGILGGSMMLLLLLYSVRKRVTLLGRLGPLRHWLNIHMTFGLFGPTAILYHCNFHLGATNSNVALVAMLIVMVSGIVGRFIYLKINDSLRGELLTFQQLQQEASDSRAEFERAPLVDEHLKTVMALFCEQELRPIRGFFRRTWRLLSLGHRIRWRKWKVMRELDPILAEASLKQRWDASIRKQQRREYRRLVASYLLSIRRISELSAFCRLFALWHVLHIPLFLMLVLTAVVHVIAVHWIY